MAYIISIIGDDEIDYLSFADLCLIRSSINGIRDNNVELKIVYSTFPELFPSETLEALYNKALNMVLENKNEAAIEMAKFLVEQGYTDARKILDKYSNNGTCKK